MKTPAWLASLALYGGLAALVFAVPLAGSKVFALRDLADYAIPQKLYAAAELRAFHLPLWNPYNYCGFPLLANLQSGVVYPPFAAVVALGLPWGIDLWIVGHVVLAALTMSWAARSLGVSRVAAAVAGLAYGFSGVVLSMNDLNAMLATSAWLPAGVAVGLGLGRSPGRRQVAIAVAVFALMFLAGEPQTLVLAGVVAAAASLVLVPATDRGRPRLVLAWVVTAVVALLLVAPVLLPFLELTAQSARSGGGLGFDEVMRHSLAPAELPALVLGRYAGDRLARQGLPGAQGYLLSTYLGASVIALAGFAPWRDRRTGFLAVVGLGGLILALGRHGLVYPWLYSIGFRQSRFPVKFLVLSAFAAAGLAGLGLDRIGVRMKAGQGAGRGGLLVVALLVLALAAALVAGSAQAIPHQREGALASAAVLLGLALVGAAFARGWLRLPSALGLVLALVAVDLASASRGLFLAVAPEDLLTPPPAVAAVRRTALSGLDRVYVGRVTADKVAYYSGSQRYDAGSVRRRLELLEGNSNLYWRIPIERGGESLEVRRVAEVLDLVDQGPTQRKLLDLLGGRWLVVLGPPPPLEDFVAAVTGEVSLAMNNRALPRAFLVPQASPASDEADELRRLADPAFDPAAQAVLAAGSAPVLGGPGEVVVRRYAARDVEIAVDSVAGGLLLLTDTYYPGWSVTLDGRATELLRADHAFRGVVVPAGSHLVRFAYAPASFRYGVLAFVVGLAALAGLLVPPRRSRGEPSEAR